MKKILVAFTLALISFELVISHSKSHSSKRQKNHHVSSKLGASEMLRGTVAGRDGSDTDPEILKAAALARYIVHNSDWLSIATQAVTEPLAGVAFANFKSFADGTKEKSTGIPYFYMTPRDETAIDLEKDNKCSVMLSMQQDGYCSKNDLDPEDEQCSRMFIIGHVDKLESGTEEFDFAKEALFERHPHMKDWPESHHFFFSKMTPEVLLIASGTGGPKTVPIDVYLETPPQSGPEH